MVLNHLPVLGIFHRQKLKFEINYTKKSLYIMADRLRPRHILLKRELGLIFL